MPDVTASPRSDDTEDPTHFVADIRSIDGDRLYVSGDGTDRAAWALRSYLRAARRHDATATRRST